MRNFKREIDKNGINETLVSEIFSAHEDELKRMKNLYNRYRVAKDSVPIMERQPVKQASYDVSRVQRLDDKINNKLNNPFDADIVDTKVGYMFGHPITYEFDTGEDENTTDIFIKDELERFLLRNNAEDQDSELGKFAAICGRGSRLAYIDMDGKEAIRIIDPWEAIHIGDDISKPDYSLWRYHDGEQEIIEFYDRFDRYVFADGELVDITKHLFDYNPLFGVANNKELQADVEKVLALIDAYDRTLSDASNEIEQWRLAYLILKGGGMGDVDEFMEQAKKGGVFELMGDDDDVKYLTKEVNDEMIENHLDRLDENIIRFAKSVNFGDESFGGNITGVALRFKIMAFENKCITMERKFTSSLRYQFKVIFSAWRKRMASISEEDYLRVWFGWKRNLPQNIADEADTTAKLKGHVSERTRLSKLSFVDDVDYEMEQMALEAKLYGDELEGLNETEELGDGDGPTSD